MALDAAYREVKTHGNEELVKKYKAIIRASIEAASNCDNTAAWIVALYETKDNFITKLYNIEDAVVVEEDTPDGVESPTS
jgi:hypothetical protein